MAKNLYGVAILMAAIVGPPGASQTPQPKAGDPVFRHAGRTGVDNIRVRDGAASDDDTVVLVGSTMGEDLLVPDRELEPNGVVLDLTRKAPTRPFTNGHAAPINSVSTGHGMVATAASAADPVVRVSDLKSRKVVAEVEMDVPFGDHTPRIAVQWLHKAARLAVVAESRIFVVDPKSPRDRMTYPPPPVGVSLSAQLAVSPDDTSIACPATLLGARLGEEKLGVVIWRGGPGAPTLVRDHPPKLDSGESIRIKGVTIGRTGMVAWRFGSGIDVPRNTAEKDVPSTRRSVLRVDPDRETTAPTGMGTSIKSWRCVFDPTGEWLAVVGEAWRDPDRLEPKDDIMQWGELRVYHAATARLVHREQVLGRYTLTWVGFSPSGKRLVAASFGGTVHWWNVERP